MKKNISITTFLSILFSLIAFTSTAQNSDTAIYIKNFTNLEEALKNPNEVFRLDLSNQLLNNTQLEALTKFKNLRFLSLKNDHLKEVPKSISELTNLRVLDLSGNDFKFLPTLDIINPEIGIKTKTNMVNFGLIANIATIENTIVKGSLTINSKIWKNEF